MTFVAAERRELNGIIARAERLTKLDWPLQFASQAWLNGKPVLLIADGPGPLAGRAVDTAVERGATLEGLASIGFCGALDPALNACDVLFDTHLSSEPVSQLEVAGQKKILSIDHVAGTIAEKAELRKTGADAVEMEAGFVAERAARLKIPFYCVKVVTDTAAESFPLDFNQLRDASGRFSIAKILFAALRNPFVTFPKLMSLNKRCAQASNALGAFIADSRF